MRKLTSFLTGIIIWSVASVALAVAPINDSIQHPVPESIELPFGVKAVDFETRGIDQPSDWSPKLILDSKVNKSAKLPYINSRFNRTVDMSTSNDTTYFPMLVLCVDFEDQLPIVPIEYFDTLFFGMDYLSVTNSYLEASLGKFKIVPIYLPSELGWLRMPLPKSYYVNGNYGFGSYPQNVQKLFEHALEAADPFVDYSLFDYNDNGWVAAGIVLVRTGSDASFSGRSTDFWAAKWNGRGLLEFDDTRVSAFMSSPEYFNTQMPATRGINVHEIGHIFGLPDLYDTDGSSRGVGDWSVMAGGSWNDWGKEHAPFDAWSRTQLGFLFPQYASGGIDTVVLKPSLETGEAFRIPIGDGTRQYYLLEFQTDGIQAKRTDSGNLLIWRIDEMQPSNSKEWYPPSTSDKHYKVAILQSDDKWNLEKHYNSSDRDDAYPRDSNSRVPFDAYDFATLTNPSSDWYGTKTNLQITEIEQFGKDSVRFIVSLCECPLQGDIDNDGDLDMDDIYAAVNILFFGGFSIQDPDCPLQRIDVDCNGEANTIDLNALIDVIAKPELGKEFCKPCFQPKPPVDPDRPEDSIVIDPR